MKSKSGVPDVRTSVVRASDYTAPWYLNQLSPVVERVTQEMPEFTMDERGLGRTIAALMQFMERELGKDASKPKPFPKLPVKLLWDFSSRGPLFWVVRVCQDFQCNQDWMLDDFNSEEEFPKSQCLELVQEIRRTWEAQGFIKTPHVHIDDGLGDEADRLMAIVKALGGSLALSQDEEGVTHHIVPFGPEGDPDDGNQYLRTLQVDDDGRAYVHWWYSPDSYNGWIPASQAPESIEPDKEPAGPWKLYPRFLYDSEKFNEWMNPIDYEPEGQDDEGTVGSGKRGAEQQGGGDSKRQRLGNEEQLPEIMPGEGSEVCAGVVKRTVGTPHPAAMDGSPRTQNLSQGQYNKEPEEVPQLAKSGAIFAPPITTSEQPATPARPEEMVEVYRVPVHASWFKWNKIHDIERRGVPEFFNGRSSRKTPEAYKEMRDFIINLFRQNKTRKLTFNECRQKLASDVSCIYRLWSFLDHWGLINFMPDWKDSDPTVLPLIQAGGLPAGAKVVSAPSAPSNLFAFRDASSAAAVKAATSGGNAFSILNRRDQYGLSAVTPMSQQPARFFCNADTSHDCTALRYHCTSIPDVDICSECFANGRFPIGMTSKNFVRIEQCAKEVGSLEKSVIDIAVYLSLYGLQGDGHWTEQETLLLLEALEVYGENWADIAEHVGTKNQVQCITHFLQLPIEDQFLNDMECSRSGLFVPQEDGSAPGMPSGDSVPFADAGNPIMAQVAFLASIVGPRVAAAAAQGALEALADEDPQPIASEARVALQEARAAGETAADGDAAKGSASAPSPPGNDTAASEPGNGNGPESGNSTPAGAVGSQGQVSGSALANAEKAPGAEGFEVVEGSPKPLTEGRLRVAAATALAAAAVKAKLLADQEEREIQRLVVGVIQNQVEKLELKMRYFEELEIALERERAALESSWMSLFVERTQLAEANLATFTATTEKPS